MESQNFLHEAPFFMLKGKFRRGEESHLIQCSMQQGQKKIVKNSRLAYDKLSEHIGRYPVVLITPDDTDIIRGGSEIRRKFFDGIIAQIDTDYLNDLLRYNHTLRQRNSLLKQFAEQNRYEGDLLDSYSEQLLQTGARIYAYRKAFVSNYISGFVAHYNNLSGQKEEVQIRYESDFDDPDFSKRFYNSYRRDMLIQRTGQGVHKDDYIFEINDFPVKKYGSQGQQKSFVIALRLTQFDLIRQEKEVKPLLLLDDIFDKLDDFRIGKLSQMVAEQSFGQLFVTDARPERTFQIFRPIEAEKKVVTIHRGKVSSEEFF
jgi:DNA replication and repair protein RecF